MANFPSLPVEIVAEILHLVVEADAESAWQYATVSREWQYYFEEKTFSSLRVSSTDIQKLRHYLTPVRQSYVRELIFKVILPDLDDYNVDVPNRERETLEVQDCNSRCFTDAVFQLFDILASWQPPPGCKLGQRQGICLHISASSPSDSIPPDYIRGADHWYKRWENSVLEIVQDVERRLPILNAVTEFTCGEYEQSSRRIAPKACCDITAQMINVQKIGWYLFNNKDFDLDRRIEMREDLIAGIQRLPESVRHFGLCYTNDMFGSKWWKAPQLFRGDPHTPDPLGVALRGLLQQLVTFTLSTTVSPEVLWPVASLATSSELGDENSMSFPYLEQAALLLREVTPAGEWRSIGLPEPLQNDSGLWRPDLYDDDIHDGPHIYTSDDRRFSKDLIRRRLVDRYLLAAGYAAQHMPRLCEFRIDWPFRLESFGLEYRPSAKDDSRAVLEFSDAPPIGPTPKVVEAWRQVAGNLLGDPMLMDIKPKDTTAEYR
ncbi:hypothetical protein BJ166DRAFT_337964 [Pestalotiopsis sp. NC0098]|nr:hypothetical protein BJ166DRAFT_337964 [Pestalotiopsis sp. NC0098]